MALYQITHTLQVNETTRHSFKYVTRARNEAGALAKFKASHGRIFSDDTIAIERIEDEVKAFWGEEEFCPNTIGAVLVGKDRDPSPDPYALENLEPGCSICGWVASEHEMEGYRGHWFTRRDVEAEAREESELAAERNAEAIAEGRKHRGMEWFAGSIG